MKKALHRSSLILMMFLMIFSSQIFIYGSTIDDTLNVTVLSDTELLLKNTEDNTSTVMTMKKDNNKISLSFYDPYTTKNEFFIVDNINGTIYSSYTNQSISKDDIYQSMEKSATETKTYRVSFAKLRSMVDNINNSYSVAAGIIAVIAAVAGISIAAGPAAIVALIGGIMSTISSGLASAKSSKGIIIRLSSKEITKHHAGGASKVTVWNVSSIGLY